MHVEALFGFGDLDAHAVVFNAFKVRRFLHRLADSDPAQIGGPLGIETDRLFDTWGRISQIDAGMKLRDCGRCLDRVDLAVQVD
ncbi:hypothetical protein D3C71_2009490 [compost metagenome]